MAFIGLPINRTLVQERLVDTVEALSLLANDVLQVTPQSFRLVLPVFPDIQNDGI
ncbi:MAG TPA: hypothetical protein VIK60_06480 [Vicinamibacterales bacterium]